MSITPMPQKKSRALYLEWEQEKFSKCGKMLEPGKLSEVSIILPFQPYSEIFIKIKSWGNNHSGFQPQKFALLAWHIAGAAGGAGSYQPAAAQPLYSKNPSCRRALCRPPNTHSLPTLPPPLPSCSPLPPSSGLVVPDGRKRQQGLLSALVLESLLDSLARGLTGPSPEPVQGQAQWQWGWQNMPSWEPVNEIIEFKEKSNSLISGNQEPSDRPEIHYSPKITSWVETQTRIHLQRVSFVFLSNSWLFVFFNPDI